MAETQKFLDQAGVQHLWSKVNMQDYPNNETLMTVINSIDETKADKTTVNNIDERLALVESGEGVSLLGSYTTMETYQTGNASVFPANCEWGVNNFITTDGNISAWANTNYLCTESFIPVEPLLSYVMFYNEKSIQFIHYAFYDAEYQLLSHSTSGTNILIAPLEAAYLRTSVYATALGIAAGEQTVDENKHLTNPTGTFEVYQQTHTNYLPGEYGEREIINKENFFIPWDCILANSIELSHCSFVNGYPAINLCDTSKMTVGYNGDTTGFGKYGSNSIYVCTEPITVSAGDKLSFWKLSNSKVNATSVEVRFVTAYDTDCNLVECATYIPTYTVPDNAIYVMVTFTLSTLGEDKNLAYIQRHEVISTYQGYKNPLEPIYKIKSSTIDAIVANTIHVCLPPEICIPSGYTIELYNNQCCLEADKYHIQWIGDYGTAYDWKYSITGDDDLIGKDFTLTMNVVNDDLSVIEQASTEIKFVSNEISTDQLIIPIGDSLTNGKLWLNNIYSTLSNKKVAFRGTRGITDPTVVNGITHEGRSGAGTEWYNSGTSTYTFDSNGLSTLPDLTTNPFWNTTTDAFDFDYYCNSAADGGAGYFQDVDGNDISLAPTGVLIFLGANGVSLDAGPATKNIVGLVDLIRNSTKGASIPIYVVNTHYRAPYIVATSADGFDTNASGEFKFQNDVKYQNLMKKLNTELLSKENVHVIPVAVTHDSAHNFPHEEENVNPYNSDSTIKKYTDTIHPSDAGYKQMAVTMYGSICAHSS